MDPNYKDTKEKSIPSDLIPKLLFPHTISCPDNYYESPPPNFHPMVVCPLPAHEGLSKSLLPHNRLLQNFLQLFHQLIPVSVINITVHPAVSGALDIQRLVIDKKALFRL